jgi:hypothetical protein
MMMMTNDDFKRLSFLADKALNATVSDNELKEFNQLLAAWNDSMEHNLFSGYHSLQLTSKRHK